MKHCIYLLALLLSYASGVHAQTNLVPNNSFEDTLTMPCGILLPGQFNGAIQHWTAPTQGATTVYATVLDPSCYNFMPHSTYSGPIGLKGTELPHTGNVMAGIFCYTISGLNQRQYLQVRLSSPLVPMETYEVSFHASLADFTELATSDLGAYLSETAIGSQNDQPLSGYLPQVTATGAVTDTATWTLISAVITATGPWEYLTIGNFLTDAQTSTQPNPGGGACVSCYGAYYYIDDVSVSHVITNRISDFQSCTVQAYPQPAGDAMHITTNAPGKKMLYVFDMFGKEMFTSEIYHELLLDMSSWPSGTYMYEIKGDEGGVRRGHFVHCPEE